MRLLGGHVPERLAPRALILFRIRDVARMLIWPVVLVLLVVAAVVVVMLR